MPSATDLATAPAPELTPELARQLIEAAKSGLFKEAAAECVGVDPEVLDTWLRMGLSPGAVEPYRSFARIYRAQESGTQLPHIRAIQAAAAVDWRASIAWLQLRYPDVWGPKATRNAQASALQPSAGDAAAEEELVRQLVRSMPPVLRRLLEEVGCVVPENLRPDDAPATA